MRNYLWCTFQKHFFYGNKAFATGSYKIEIILLFESFIQSFIANIGV